MGSQAPRATKNEFRMYCNNLNSANWVTYSGHGVQVVISAVSHVF